VRQLKNEATQVVRAVREERAVYVVTVSGEPVAVLRPYSERDIAGSDRGQANAEIATIERLAEAVGRAWLTLPALPDGGGTER
jgi:prevent-host-death family protein